MSSLEAEVKEMESLEKPAENRARKVMLRRMVLAGIRFGVTLGQNVPASQLRDDSEEFISVKNEYLRQLGLA